MRVWLVKLKFKIQKPLLELLGQSRTCGKTASEKFEPLVSIRSGARGCQSIRTGLAGRRRLKLSLIESAVG